jgi:hypothetical protein
MSAAKRHTWTFRSRFRASGFGWRSELPIKRIKEAVGEIKKVTRTDSVLGAEGAVIFIEKLPAAIEHVDSSSGAIGTAVNRAIEAVVPIIAMAPASEKLRKKWLDRLWEAIEQDQMPYLEMLADYWGDLCATPERASQWADRFLEGVRLMWNSEQPLGGNFKGTSACLSCLCAAGRHDELLTLLELAPHKFWYDRQWGVRALVAQGKSAAAIRYAEGTRGLNQSNSEISSVCEEILLSAGMWREAYDRYASDANRRGTYLATFQAIKRKYPQLGPDAIIRDLVNGTPGEEGKWFAAAKSAGLLSLAANLASQSPCDPRTLVRAAKDFRSNQPEFSVAVGLAAIKWMLQGYGYELLSRDVSDAFDFALDAAKATERETNTVLSIRQLVEGHAGTEPAIKAILRQKLANFPSTSAY